MRVPKETVWNNIIPLWSPLKYVTRHVISDLRSKYLSRYWNIFFFEFTFAACTRYSSMDACSRMVLCLYTKVDNELNKCLNFLCYTNVWFCFFFQLLNGWNDIRNYAEHKYGNYSPSVILITKVNKLRIVI